MCNQVNKVKFEKKWGYQTKTNKVTEGKTTKESQAAEFVWAFIMLLDWSPFLRLDAHQHIQHDSKSAQTPQSTEKNNKASNKPLESFQSFLNV